MASLISISEYKTYAGISGTSFDAQLTILVNWASAYIRRMTGRNLTDGFESKSRTETYDGTGNQSIQLNENPVTTITSVTRVNDDGSTYVYDSTAYRVDADTGILYALTTVNQRFIPDTEFRPQDAYFGAYPIWPEGFNNISVVYTGGYATIPDDLKGAMYQLVDLLFANIRRDPTMLSENLGGYAYTKADPKMREQIMAGIIAMFGRTES